VGSYVVPNFLFSIPSVIESVFIESFTAPTSAGLATISIGHTGLPDIVTGIPYQNLGLGKGVTIFSNEIADCSVGGFDLVFKINVAALTAGAIGFQINFNEYQI
jgi:hypothetical protein